MLKLKSLLAFLLISQFCIGQGIEFFNGTWAEALEEASKDDKIVFVDSYAQWCGPCKRMAKTEFTKPEVGDFYNENFISVKLDMEKEDGMKFGSKYPVSAFPTLFFLDSQGNILKKVTGGQKGEQLIALGKLAIKSYDKTEALEALYNEGKRDHDLMVTYVKELNKVDKPSMKISNEYLKSNPDISKSQKAQFLMEAVTESDSKLFDQLIALKKEAITGSSEDLFKAKVESAVLATVRKAVEYDYKELVDEAIAQYKTADIGKADKFKSKAYLEYHALNGDYNEWKNYSKSYLKKNGKKNPELYKDHLGTLSVIFYHVEESSDYSNELFKNLIKRDDSTPNYQAYVKFLTKTKQNDVAVKVLKEAIKKAKSRKEDVTQMERMLDYLS